MDVEQELQRGIALHHAGRLGDAARCYQAVLAVDPANVDALNLMSALANQAGDAQLAAELARQGIASDPSYFALYLSLGNALQAMGDMAGAAEAFRQCVARNAQTAEGYSNLANALNACGDFQDASDAAVRALTLNPDLPQAHNGFGNALVGLDSPGEAVECYEKALALDPEYADAWHNLGNALVALGEAESAIEPFVRSIALEDSAVKRYNLGNALLTLARYEEAAGCFAQAIELDGHSLDAWMNLSVALKSLGRLEDAEAVQRDAVTHAPDDPEAHFNLAVLLLQQGKCSEGWDEYEWRWRLPQFQSLVRNFDKPVWDGRPLDGQTLLITAEQGFGDAIQFVRLLPLVAARGARIVLECRPGLGRLFATLPCCAEVVTMGDPLPAFDCHLPLMSLPRVLAIGLDSIPAAIPYLGVPEETADFSDVAGRPGLKIGIAWAGKATRGDNAQRSCSLSDFKALGAVPGVSLFSLQVGASERVGDGITDLAPRLGDFADTAAAIAALDLIVTVDTSVAHLAGALGKPLFVLLSRPSSGFLWMEDREDTPWYPSARLLRQPAPGDWSGVMARVCELAARYDFIA